MDKTIEISMEEYKELLMTKGKYEELKSQSLTSVIDLGYKNSMTNPNVTLL